MWKLCMVSRNWSTDNTVCKGFPWLAPYYTEILLLLIITISFWITCSISEGDVMYGSKECWTNEMKWKRYRLHLSKKLFQGNYKTIANYYKLIHCHTPPCKRTSICKPYKEDHSLAFALILLFTEWHDGYCLASLWQ
jgi:hypothetical protein